MVTLVVMILIYDIDGNSDDDIDGNSDDDDIDI